jgi:hypothetical protein
MSHARWWEVQGGQHGAASSCGSLHTCGGIVAEWGGVAADADLGVGAQLEDIAVHQGVVVAALPALAADHTAVQNGAVQAAQVCLQHRRGQGEGAASRCCSKWSPAASREVSGAGPGLAHTQHLQRGR